MVASRSPSDDDYDCAYTPEYEPELVNVGGNLQLQVMSLVPPPLEFMSQLHSQRQEISGRQVWTGSLLLAQVLYHFNQKEPSLLRHQRCVNSMLTSLGISCILSER
jgi:hypothetical protein